MHEQNTHACADAKSVSTGSVNVGDRMDASWSLHKNWFIFLEKNNKIYICILA